jgi:hypothetical protein
MKNHIDDHSQEVFANQDLHQLLQCGRTLHDQAVCAALGGLTGWVRQFFRKHISVSKGGNKIGHHGHRGLPAGR